MTIGRPPLAPLPVLVAAFKDKVPLAEIASRYGYALATVINKRYAWLRAEHPTATPAQPAIVTDVPQIEVAAKVHRGRKSGLTNDEVDAEFATEITNKEFATKYGLTVGTVASMRTESRKRTVKRLSATAAHVMVATRPIEGVTGMAQAHAKSHAANESFEIMSARYGMDRALWTSTKASFKKQIGDPSIRHAHPKIGLIQATNLIWREQGAVLGYRAPSVATVCEPFGGSEYQPGRPGDCTTGHQLVGNKCTINVYNEDDRRTDYAHYIRVMLNSGQTFDQGDLDSYGPFAACACIEMGFLNLLKPFALLHFTTFGVRRFRGNRLHFAAYKHRLGCDDKEGIPTAHDVVRWMARQAKIVNREIVAVKHFEADDLWRFGFVLNTVRPSQLYSDNKAMKA